MEKMSNTFACKALDHDYSMVVNTGSNELLPFVMVFDTNSALENYRTACKYANFACNKCSIYSVQECADKMRPIFSYLRNNNKMGVFVKQYVYDREYSYFAFNVPSYAHVAVVVMRGDTYVETLIFDANQAGVLRALDFMYNTTEYEKIIGDGGFNI